jgi:hypothetical protein
VAQQSRTVAELPLLRVAVPFLVEHKLLRHLCIRVFPRTIRGPKNRRQWRVREPAPRVVPLRL